MKSAILISSEGYRRKPAKQIIADVKKIVMSLWEQHFNSKALGDVLINYTKTLVNLLTVYTLLRQSYYFII